MFTRYKAVAAVALLLVGASPATAEIGCHQRIYSEAHLAGKPQQRVAAISITKSDAPVTRKRGQTTRVEIRLRGGATASQELECKLQGGSYYCLVEGDGGSVELRRHAGGMSLRVLDGFRFETSTGFVDLAKSDDRTFRLDTAACR